MSGYEYDNLGGGLRLPGGSFNYGMQALNGDKCYSDTIVIKLLTINQLKFFIKPSIASSKTNLFTSSETLEVLMLLIDIKPCSIDQNV